LLLWLPAGLVPAEGLVLVPHPARAMAAAPTARSVLVVLIGSCPLVCLACPRVRGTGDETSTARISVRPQWTTGSCRVPPWPWLIRPPRRGLSQRCRAVATRPAAYRRLRPGQLQRHPAGLQLDALGDRRVLAAERDQRLHADPPPPPPGPARARGLHGIDHRDVMRSGVRAAVKFVDGG
jgi:hypothetical protein